MIGRELRIDGTPHRIIGVVASPTRFPHDADLWLPLTSSMLGASPSHSLQLFGRLALAVSRQSRPLPRLPSSRRRSPDRTLQMA